MIISRESLKVTKKKEKKGELQSDSIKQKGGAAARAGAYTAEGDCQAAAAHLLEAFVSCLALLLRTYVYTFDIRQQTNKIKLNK